MYNTQKQAWTIQDFWQMHVSRSTFCARPMEKSVCGLSGGGTVVILLSLNPNDISSNPTKFML